MSGETEQWRAVVGFEGCYEVLNLGRVRSLWHNRGFPLKTPRILRPRLHTKGYVRVMLGNTPHRLDKYIHAVVLEAFLGPRPVGKEVNHLDGVKSNNRLENLEYVTHHENITHSVRTGLWKPEDCSLPGSLNGGAILCETMIPSIRLMAETHTMDEVAAHFGISRSTAHRIYRRNAWKHVA